MSLLSLIVSIACVSISAPVPEGSRSDYSHAALPSEVNQSPRMFMDIDRPHWVYDIADRLSSTDTIWCYPKGYFSSGRVLTRYEFAIAVDKAIKILRDEERTSLQSVSSIDKRFPWTVSSRFEIADAGPLLRMVDEFEEELRALGADLAKARTVLLDDWEKSESIGNVPHSKLTTLFSYRQITLFPPLVGSPEEIHWPEPHRSEVSGRR